MGGKGEENGGDIVFSVTLRPDQQRTRRATITRVVVLMSPFRVSDRDPIKSADNESTRHVQPTGPLLTDNIDTDLCFLAPSR